MKDDAAKAFELYDRETRLIRALAEPVPVVRTLLIAIIAVYVAFFVLTLVMNATGFDGQMSYGAMIVFGAKLNTHIDNGEWWRLLTCQLIHANLLHLVMNAAALVMVGPIVERLLGPVRFVIVCATAGVMGAVASYLFNDGASVGASGAVFGLFGALVVFALKYRERMPAQFSSNLLSQIAPIIVLNAVIGFTVPRIDNAAHFGGLAGGALAALVLRSRVSEERTSDLGMRVVFVLVALAYVVALAMMVRETVACGGSIPAFNMCYADL